MQPLIGITTYGRAEHPAPSTHYAVHYSVPTDYVDAVRRAGGTPVLLPSDETNWKPWVAKLDGIVLSGGTDVSPSHYSDTLDNPHVEANAPERDTSEIALTLALVESQKPSLFVCRGIQVLNVALGGTLFAHLPEVVDDDIHRDENGFWTTHQIAAEPGSRVAKAMGSDQAVTYSGHHQAINRLGFDLAISALAPDGIIEAIEMPDHPWVVGVQWHPEITAHSDPTQQGIFDALITACG